MTWISTKDRHPDKVGLYKVKTPSGEGEAFFANTLGGKLVWVVPDGFIITHWLGYKEDKLKK